MKTKLPLLFLTAVAASAAQAEPIARQDIQHALECKTPPMQTSVLIAELQDKQTLKQSGIRQIAPINPFYSQYRLPYVMTLKTVNGMDVRSRNLAVKNNGGGIYLVADMDRHPQLKAFLKEADKQSALAMTGKLLPEERILAGKKYGMSKEVSHKIPDPEDMAKTTETVSTYGFWPLEGLKKHHREAIGCRYYL
ncbi:hypothetical protein [Neisseria sp.]|uniref:hypothetical protein n=1 Tax=Neisseria sp. TaxID=192066 RepID=UPI0035A05327